MPSSILKMMSTPSPRDSLAELLDKLKVQSVECHLEPTNENVARLIALRALIRAKQQNVD